METERWWKNRISSVSCDKENRKRYYSTLSDEALCMLYRQTNEQEIILILLDRYDRYLIFLALPFVHVLDSIGDYKTDLFLVLHKLLKTSKPKKFKHWLGTIARNKIYDRVRKKRPELMEELPEKKLEALRSWDFSLDFESVLLAIEKLKTDQRLYVEMAFFGGYKQREIREMFGWPREKPRVVRQNAIKNLRKLLAGKASDFLAYL